MCVCLCDFEFSLVVPRLSVVSLLLIVFPLFQNEAAKKKTAKTKEGMGDILRNYSQEI